VGGHSDLIAGGITGNEEILTKVRRMRNYLGTMLDSHSCWLLTRSLETVRLRMDRAFSNARVCAEFLRHHPKVTKVMYPGFLEAGDPQKKVYDEQCEAAGATFSFDVAGGKEAAFRMLDQLKLIKLAVSLGGTESLMCHPGSTTHSAVPADVRARIGFTDGLVRFSVGIEAAEDLVVDRARRWSMRDHCTDQANRDVEFPPRLLVRLVKEKQQDERNAHNNCFVYLQRNREPKVHRWSSGSRRAQTHRAAFTAPALRVKRRSQVYRPRGAAREPAFRASCHIRCTTPRMANRGWVGQSWLPTF
jgi:hypothetical protein